MEVEYILSLIFPNPDGIVSFTINVVLSDGGTGEVGYVTKLK